MLRLPVGSVGGPVGADCYLVDLAWIWHCEQLKLPQWRHRNHEVGDSELRETNHCVSFLFTFLFTF
jgi:hypothetical protein